MRDELGLLQPLEKQKANSKHIRKSTKNMIEDFKANFVIWGLLAVISGCLGLEIMEPGAEGSMFSFQDQYQGGANGVFIC